MPRTNEIKKVVPGRAQPSQTLPPGGGLGKPGFPSPLLGVGVRLLHPEGGGWEGGRAARGALPDKLCPYTSRTPGSAVITPTRRAAGTAARAAEAASAGTIASIPRPMLKVW